MNYLIMDLEWNNTFGRKVNLNEIIEMGAVLLDERLQEIGRFSTFIRPRIAKKLSSRTKNLTHITNADLEQGIPFLQALYQLKDFIGPGVTTVLSWGDADLRVLIDNLKYFSDTDRIPFLRYYLDLQKYYHAVRNRPHSQQISLSGAAEDLGIDPEEYALHRALDDSVLSAECLRRTFDPVRVSEMLLVCNEEFYDRLSFKPYVISNLNHPSIQKEKLKCICDRCGQPAERMGTWRFFNSAFHAVFFCKHCNRKINFSIRFKQYYDHLDVRVRAVDYVRRKKEEQPAEQSTGCTEKT